MELTGRQREFLGKFLDLYHEAQGPLHYSRVAEALGVSSITAYDMLRLLEERRLVRSDYLLPDREQGPGRSTIVFSPTQKARTLFARLIGDEWDAEEWAGIRERILESLRAGRDNDYQQLLAEIVARIPESESPMDYLAKMITAMILTLHQIKDNATTSLSESLRGLGLPNEIGLSALAGLSVGLSFVERANRQLTRLLASYTDRYQQILAGLSPENCRRLADLVQDIIRQIELSVDHNTGP